ncbi:MAG: M36 family metallopeptidase, partial [Candidatus Poribacteria bacterium]|nr:M36 family metallopeptidase [Candidatus Poribacteria bacterium]
MRRSICWSLLTIGLLVFSAPILAQQSAPKSQFSPPPGSYLVPKSSAPNLSSQRQINSSIQSNRSLASKRPINPDDPLVEFQTKYPNAQIVLHEGTGLPHLISNLQSERRSGSAVQIARVFLREHQNLLLPDGGIPDLELVEVMRSQAAEHVHFQQVYQGIPVYLGVITVHIQDGRVVMYTGTYHPPSAFRNLPPQPSLSESAAMEIAMQQLRGISPVWLRGDSKTGLYIYAADAGTYHLAYQVQLPTGAPLGDWEFLIDAHTGEVLQQVDLLMHVNGQARIYEENPITTGPPRERPLDSLDGSGFLKGDFVNVLVYDGPPGVLVKGPEFRVALANNAFSQQNDFRYDPATEPRLFDEANVYFHIDRIHDYFKGRFNFTGRDEPFRVIVRHPNINPRNDRVLSSPLNNAFFSPITQSLGIGEGTGTASGGLNNLARDADILYHEYTHGVVNRITRLGIRQDDFGGAMNEAYADYFPCSFFDDPDLGEWSVSNLRGLRNLDNDNRFPDEIFLPGTSRTEVHFTGLIWGGGLWSLRERIGARDADRIIFDSLSFLPRDGSANFQKGLTALLAADRALFDVEHQDSIREVFNARGI